MTCLACVCVQQSIFVSPKNTHLTYPKHLSNNILLGMLETFEDRKSVFTRDLHCINYPKKSYVRTHLKKSIMWAYQCTQI